MTRAERMKLTLLGRRAVEDVPIERYISAGCAFGVDADELRRLHSALAVAYTRFHAALNRDGESRRSTWDDPPHHNPRLPCPLDARVYRSMTNGEVMDGVDRRLVREAEEAEYDARRTNPACVAADARAAQAARDARKSEAEAKATQRRLNEMEERARIDRGDATAMRRAMNRVHAKVFPPAPKPREHRGYLAPVNMQGRYGSCADDNGNEHYETPGGVRVIRMQDSGRLVYENGAPFHRPRAKGGPGGRWSQ